LKLILGLGNPGSTYVSTRHNIGFLVVDCLAERWKIGLKERYKQTEMGSGMCGDVEVALAKPLTWMNLSGTAARFLLKEFGLQKEDLIVVHDDMDLPLGVLRWSVGSGAGGHNGVQSVIEQLEGKDFVRLRCGVGRPPSRVSPADYVLQGFLEEEEVPKLALVKSAADSTEEYLKFGLQWVQQKYHRLEEPS